METFTFLQMLTIVLLNVIKITGCVRCQRMKERRDTIRFWPFTQTCFANNTKYKLENAIKLQKDWFQMTNNMYECMQMFASLIYSNKAIWISVNWFRLKHWFEMGRWIQKQFDNKIFVMICRKKSINIVEMWN